jgi:hypothetical protein
VHDALHLAWWDEHAVLHPFHAHETVAGAVGAYHALNNAARASDSASL